MMGLNARGRWLNCTVVLYAYIPIVLFLWGFTRWYFALPTTAILGYGAYKFLSDIFEEDKEKALPTLMVSPWVIGFSVVLLLFVCIVCGIGGFFPQAGDWYKHNAVLNDLINLSWPVYYDEYGKCMLTYYLGQYLVPALIGKMAGGFLVGSFALFIICVFGLYVIYLLLIRATGADTALKQIVLLFIMLFFCGALNLTQNFLFQMYNGSFYSYGSYHWVLMNSINLQYRSNAVMIRWILPQIVVPWMTVLLFLEQRKKTEYYVFMILPSLLFGSFSFAALVMIALCEAIYMLYMKECGFKHIFTLSNILPAITLGPILFFYFLGNIQVDKPISSSFRFQIYTAEELPLYFVFSLCMFGVYFGCTYIKYKNDPQWYINLAILLILPWLKMGLCNDVVMSGSIPSLFICMIMVCNILFDRRESTNYGICKGILIMFLLIGAIYPIREICDNIKANSPGMELADSYPTMRWFTNRKDPDISEDLVYNYYTYDMDGKIFYEYIARKK